MYYPSVAAVLHKRVCITRGKYFASQVAVRLHTEARHQADGNLNHEEGVEDDDDESLIGHDAQPVNVNTKSVVIVRNIFQWLQSNLQQIKR